MLSYGLSKTDSRGCTYSIDNLVAEYIVKSFNQDSVLGSLSEIFQSVVPAWDRAKCCRENLPACSRFSWFKSSIWGGGFYIQYGQYRDFDKVSGEWTEYPLLRIKFNPNKYWNSELFPKLLEWLDYNCDNGALVKFDFAVDVPARIKDLQVHSRKEPGLYKGTLYYGQRNKHGRLKIYDKKAESELPDDVTRVEWTFCCGKPLVFDDVLWLTNGPEPLPDARELGKSYAYARLLLTIRSLGGDVGEALGYLDRRTAKKLEPYTIGSGVQLMGDGSDVLVPLLRAYCTALSVSFKSEGVNAVSIGSGFSRLSQDDLEADELPF